MDRAGRRRCPTGAEHGRNIRPRPQLLDQLGRCQVEHPTDGLAARTLQQRRRALPPVQDPGPDGPGLEDHAENVGGGHRLGCEEAGEQPACPGVDAQQVPATVHDHGRQRLVLGKHPRDRGVHPIQSRVVERPFDVDPILTVETAPTASRPVLEGIAADLGFVPNLAATIAASPTLLRGFDGLRRAVGDESFDPRLRETAGVAVGLAVDNAYGVAFHSTVLGRLGVGESDIEAMRQGSEPSGAKPAAAYAFARALVLDRGAVDPSVIERALAAGLTRPDLLQLVAECVFASLVGFVDNLAGRVELDDFLRPQPWK